MTINCPSDCPHLVAAYRYEAEHRKPLVADGFPYRDIEFSPDFVYERWAVVAGLASTILIFQTQNGECHDGIAYAALEALAETYRTLEAGIFYERPPDAHLPRALYGQIASFLQEFRKQEASRAGVPALKDSDTFRLLVFLLRVCKQETSGRPRSRAFLHFLRLRFAPPAEAVKDGPRIILP